MKKPFSTSRPLFDGLYAFKQRAQMLGREPA
jgi:hypothetical protein